MASSVSLNTIKTYLIWRDSDNLN